MFLNGISLDFYKNQETSILTSILFFSLSYKISFADLRTLLMERSKFL